MDGFCFFFSFFLVMLLTFSLLSKPLFPLSLPSLSPAFSSGIPVVPPHYTPLRGMGSMIPERVPARTSKKKQVG